MVNVTIAPGQRAAVSTGIKIKPPRGSYVRLAGRSGLSFNHGLFVISGVIDSDFLGVVQVLLFNSGNKSINVKIGDRIAQAIVEKYKKCSIIEAKIVDDTERGEHGFGSTGQ